MILDFIYNKKIAIPLVFAVFLNLNSIVVAQDREYLNPDRCLERRGLEYGAVAGFYIAGFETADFYSGKPENENNVDYVFGNPYWYDEIFLLMGAYDTIIVREYPQKMKYTPAFSFGLFVKYDINCHTGIYLQFSYAKLTAKDVVTMEVDPPIDYLAEPDIRLSPIFGTEERNLVDLGFTRAIGYNKAARFVFGGGVNMNNTLVKEHLLRIEGVNSMGNKDYNLVNVYGNNSYVPGGTQQAYEIRQGGIGFGFFGTVGARFEFSPAIAIEPVFTMYYKHIAIEPESGLTPQYNFSLRICFRELLTF